MKQGGYSWNMSYHRKQGVRERHACKHCGRQYKMKWALENHVKLCKEKKCHNKVY